MQTQKTLTDRRAIFVYESARLAAIMANAPIVPAPWHDRDMEFKAQLCQVIARQCSPDRKTSAEELHEDWCDAYSKMGWRYGLEYDIINKTHPDMVPYHALNKLERDKDEVFIALCEIARRWIRY